MGSSVLVVILISLGHLRSLYLSELVQNGMTSVKFLLLGLFLLVGFWNVLRHPSVLAILAPVPRSLPELLQPSSGVALIFVLYAYSGWNASTYLAGEVRNRQRTVGLSLVIGTLVVTLLYFLLNAVFLTAAPIGAMRGVLNVGSVAATSLLGAMGGSIMSGMIALGLLASLSAMIWAGPRVTQRVGEDYKLFRVLSQRSVGGIPVNATVLQLLLILILVATGSFKSVLLYAQTPLLLCLILGVAGIFVLRRRGSSKALTEIPIAFRCPLYPLPPLLFIICTLAALVYSTLSNPWIALAGFATMLLPLGFYPWLVSQGSRSYKSSS
jgi:APA family basic amino acid/polyamine antiporter